MGYMKEEMEDHIWYDDFTKTTKGYARTRKGMGEFKRAGWDIVDIEEENGKVVSMTFQAKGRMMKPKKVKQATS